MGSGLRFTLGIIAATASIAASVFGSTLADSIAYWFNNNRKKPEPQSCIVWVMFYFAAFITVVFGSIAAFAPAPVIPSSSAPTEIPVLPNPLAQASPTPPVSTATLADIVTATPTTQLPSAESAQKWSEILSARKPTSNEVKTDNPISLWDANNIDVQDLSTPGTASYSGVAKVGQEYLFLVYWCALSVDQLHQNMGNIETTFSINGETLPSSYISVYEIEAKSGWKCNYQATILSGWIRKTSYSLQAKRSFVTDILDGRTTYPTGNYIYNLNINVP